MQTNSGHYGVPEVISSQFMVANSTTNTTTGGGRRREESLPSSSSIFPHHLLGHNHVSSLSSNPLLQASIHRYIQQQATSPHFQEKILQPSSQVLSRNEEQQQYDEFQAASVGLLGQRQKLSGMQSDSPQEVLTARPAVSSLDNSLLVISNSNDNKKKDSIVTTVGGDNNKNEDDSKVVLGKVGMGRGSDEEIEDGGTVGVGTNRWPRDETLALLKTRADMEGIFRESLAKGRLWEEISRKLAELGYNRSAKKCKEKFENVHKYYKRTKDGKAGRQDGKNYRFFSQLESLYTKKNNSANDYTSPRGNANKDIPMMRSNVHNTPQKPPQEEEEEEEEEEAAEAEAEAADVGGNAFCNKSGVSLFSLPRSSPTLVERFVPNNTKVVEPTYNIPSNFSSNSSSSSSSEEDYHDPIDTKRKKKRKRRLKSSDNMMQFFEHLMKKVIDKQEELQQKFLEALERRDKERMIREEAWKSQEMARLGKELELRSQESAMAASRDTALVAFLQQAAGQNFQLPTLALTRINTVANPIFTTNAASEDQLQSFSSDPINKRWPKPEVVTLIKLRSGFDSRFREAGPKGQIWKQISAEMSALGFNRSPNRCKEKWENINKYFKKTRENNKKRSENSKTCPYFTQLDLLYKRGLLGSSSKHNLIALKSKLNQSENPEDPGRSIKRGGENSEEEEEANRETLPQVLAIMPSQGETDAKEGDHSAENIIRH